MRQAAIYCIDTEPPDRIPGLLAGKKTTLPRIGTPVTVYNFYTGFDVPARYVVETVNQRYHTYTITRTLL